MLKLPLNSLIACLCLGGTLVLSPLQAGPMYRWVDDNGQVQFGDRIPPQYAKHGHEVLSDDGRVVERVEREKTPEELAQLAAEKARQEAELEKQAEQARYDAMLLRTFTSTDDIDRTLSQRVASIQSQINLDQATMGGINHDLRSNLKRRQKYIEDEDVIPPQLILNINELRSRQHELDQEIMKKKQLQLEIRQKLLADRERFVELKSPKEQQS